MTRASGRCQNFGRPAPEVNVYFREQMKPSKFEFQEHEFGRPRPQKVRILLGQARTAPTDWTSQRGLAVNRNPRDLQEWVHNVIARASQHSVDLVLLPELSVPASSIVPFQSWSKQNGTIVIAGSHYSSGAQGTVARCPVVIAGEVHFVEKLAPAPAEQSPIAGEGLTPGRIAHVFTGTSVGNFAVLICSDYLEPDLRRETVGKNLDFLLVPAFQRDSTAYHDRMHIDCDDKSSGLYVVYANMRCTEYADGRSAIFAVTDRLFREKLVSAGVTNASPLHKAVELSGGDDLLVMDFDIDFKRPTVPRTVSTHPNIKVVYKSEATPTQQSRFIDHIAHDDERYERIDEFFVPPDEYPEILSLLENSKLVLIVGDPGIGKTYTAVKLLRHYFELGYEPVWYTGLEREERIVQRKMLEEFKPRPRQICYFEDPFGRSVFERRDALFQVFGPLRDRLEGMDARVIITSRKQIFEQFSRESLAARELAEFTSEMNVVKPSYSGRTLTDILTRLAAGRCAWFASASLRRMVFSAVHNGSISTPLALRDLVMSTENVTSESVLKQRVFSRKKESARSFAPEFIACSPSSKLAMLLVHLLGTRQPQQLMALFDEVAQAFGDQFEVRMTTFMQELRGLLGHRVEKYGGTRGAYRFSHPQYEEAFVEAAGADAVITDLATLLIPAMARNSRIDAAMVILRHQRKYPDFTARLLRLLIEVVLSRNEAQEIVGVGLRLIGGYQSGGSDNIVDFLAQLVPLEWVLARIQSEINEAMLARLLRLAVNIELRGPSADPGSLRQAIDWQSLYQRLSLAPSFSNVLSALEWAARIRPEAPREFMSRMSSSLLKRRFASIDSQVRSQIEAATRSEELLALIKHVGTVARRSWKDIRRDIPQEAIQGAAIIVDDGATRAITTLTFRKGGMNLLPCGVVDVQGEFSEGDSVEIVDTRGERVGFGMVEYSAREIRDIRGRHSSLIAELIHRYHGPAVVSRDAMIIDESRHTIPVR